MSELFSTIASLCFLATIVGLIKPGIFRFKSRKAAALYGFGSTFVFQLIAVSLESDDNRQQPETEQAARQDPIAAAEKTQRKAEQTREASASSSKPKKPEDAVVDSVALYETLDRMVNKAERLIPLAQAALDGNRFHEALSLTDSVETYLKGITDNLENEHPKRLRLSDLGLLKMRIQGFAKLGIEEAKWDSMGFFRYEKGTVERAAEERVIRWAFGVPKDRDNEPVVDYSFLKRGRKLRVVKNISVEDGRLTINMRPEPDDIVKRDYSAGQISFIHPVGLLKNFRYLCYQLWSTRPSEWLVKRFRGIEEIELVVYYPGGQSGTENQIARFGIGRKALEGTSWRDIHPRDGTFQDLLKKKGTYWLHPEVPDMGTPAHLVR